MQCGRRAVIPGLLILQCSILLNAQGQTDIPSPTNTVIVAVKGAAQISSPAVPAPVSATVNQPLLPGDRIHVLPESQVAIRKADAGVVRLDEKTDLQLQAPKSPGAPSWSFRLFSGFIHFLHRDKPAELEIESRSVTAVVRGTDFTVGVDDSGTTVTVFNGAVEMTNALGRLTLTNQQQGFAAAGQPPVLRPAIDTMSVIQWTLYYPGVLDLEELPLLDSERTALASSLTNWVRGNLVAALTNYPAALAPASAAGKIYRAALLLAVGQVDDAQPLLASIPRDQSGDAERTARLAEALEQLVAVVKLRPRPTNQAPLLATEWLVESYRQQFALDLDKALRAARAAVERSPRFGFAWERVAELEFSFGRIDRASEALAHALSLSPENAQAVALNGFLLAAKNKISAAIDEFNRAIELDNGLANGWLGRGLCRIRQGNARSGREDLLVAASLEPQRAFLRGYLGKAWTDNGRRALAGRELELAKELDPRDPTAWLYSALLKQQYNQINEAIRELEHAQDLGTNRAIYRSSFLLDQDRAVRSVNLAHIYRDAGMTDWSVLEAGRAVASDYANYSAHLFLANSYDELRDPNRISLRYETPAESEYLIANLLAPAGAGTLSQSISQSEYSKLFERNRFGAVSHTEYLSRGAWYENGAQFGTFGNTSYSFEGVYRSDNGQRPNNDFEERELRLHLKQQLTPKDSIYFRAVEYESAGGDRFQYYDPATFNPTLRVKEDQQPALVLGYHHEWGPGSHFILAGARFDDTYEVDDQKAYLWKRFELFGELNALTIFPVAYRVRTRLELYSAEAQQIWETPKNNFVVGGRYQSGDFNVRNLSFDPGPEIVFFPPPAALPDADPRFERWSGYLYDSFRLFDPLLLSAGFSYDRMTFPSNFRSPPVSAEQTTRERFSPKAGVVWTPGNSTTVRAAYTRSLAGASLDQSLRLEPTQIAGFNQAFRSILPESIAGANAGAEFTTYDVSIEQRFWQATYVAAGVELLDSDLTRSSGAYRLDPLDPVLGPFVAPSSIEESLRYRERSLFLSLHQLIGHDWALGARYRLAEARFNDLFPAQMQTPMPGDLFQGDQHVKSALHELDLRAVYNQNTGFFARADAWWFLQSNSGYSAGLPGDEFWQFDLIAGYRFLRRRAQIAAGLLNITDADYRLNPLILYNERPRDRTFVVRLDLSF